MHVQRVILENFRNYNSLDLEPVQGTNILYGDNAQGKTNFLESVYMCATGRSQRTANTGELIRFGGTDAHIRVFVGSESGNSYDRIDVHLKKNSGKGIALNGLPIKKIGQLYGALFTVIFSPEDLQLLKAGPGERRKFMDAELCQLSSVYYYELQQYYRALKQRNNLLKSMRYKKDLYDSVFVWNEQLVAHGTNIINYRTEFVSDMNETAGAIHADITQGREKLSLMYKPHVAPGAYEDKLNRSLERDISSGTTNIGIHKDDVIFTISGNDARIYGSQGQQRTACLSAKLAEINLIGRKKNKTPVLLLDDVLSELDESRQRYLLGHAAGVQTFITCTGTDSFIRTDMIKLSDSCKVFKVENGNIEP